MYIIQIQASDISIWPNLDSSNPSYPAGANVRGGFRSSPSGHSVIILYKVI